MASTRSAPHRVFDIPELLEIILILVAESELRLSLPLPLDFSVVSSCRPQDIKDYAFIKSPLCLQQVSTNFRDTILGSSKLKDLRLEGISFVGDKLQPIDWLLMHMDHWHTNLPTLGASSTSANDTTRRVLARRYHWFGECQGLDQRPEASWRRVLCTPLKEGKLTLRLYVRDHRPSKWIQEIVVLGKHTTLGKMADMLNELWALHGSL